MKDLRLSIPVPDRETFVKANKFVADIHKLKAGEVVDLSIGGAKYEGLKIKEVKSEGGSWKVDSDGVFPSTMSILIEFVTPP